MTNRTITPKRTQSKHLCPNGEPCCLDHEIRSEHRHQLCICSNPRCSCHSQERYNPALADQATDTRPATRRRALSLLLGLGIYALFATPVNAQTCQSRRTPGCANPANPNRRTITGRRIPTRRRIPR